MMTEIKMIALFSVCVCLLSASLVLSDTATNDKDKKEDSNIELKHVESSTSSIKIQWKLMKESDDIDHYEVTSQKKESDQTYHSTQLRFDHDGTMYYEVIDLVKDSDYEVCVMARDENHNEVDKECKFFSTIRLIRPDSLIGLFCALGFFAVCIILGYIFSRYAAKKAQAEAEGDDEREKIIPDENQQV